MRRWPDFDKNGDLPVGVHQGTLAEVIDHFGTESVQRRLVALRLERIYKLAYTTEQVARFVVFGSFVTAKAEPEDVDVFLLMEDAFESQHVQGEAGIVFDHLAVQNLEGASVFWIRRQAAIDGEQAAVEYWQIKRDKTRRGIVEVIQNDSQRSGT